MDDTAQETFEARFRALSIATGNAGQAVKDARREFKAAEDRLVAANAAARAADDAFNQFVTDEARNCHLGAEVDAALAGAE